MVVVPHVLLLLAATTTCIAACKPCLLLQMQKETTCSQYGLGGGRENYYRCLCSGIDRSGIAQHHRAPNELQPLKCHRDDVAG